MFKTQSVGSVSEFLDQVAKYQKRWEGKNKFPWSPWFRGEPNRRSPTRLRPKLYRPSLGRQKLMYEEQELRTEFRRHAASMMQGHQPAGDLAHWEWYFLMQHYGAPTRLLDWSDGSLVGLYFAVSGERSKVKDNADAAVYMLDPYWLNDLAFKDMKLGKSRPTGVALPDWPEAAEYLAKDPFDGDRLRPKLPLAITPNQLSQRFAAQKSQFTIYGRDRGGRLLKFAEENDSRIRVIPIEANKIPALLQELKRCGISESVVFPDMDGLGRELRMEWEARCAARQDPAELPPG